MAPNRNSVASILETLSSNDLQSLQNTVQPKFLPLTHPNSSEELVDVASLSNSKRPVAPLTDQTPQSLTEPVVAAFGDYLDWEDGDNQAEEKETTKPQHSEASGETEETATTAQHVATPRPEQEQSPAEKNVVAKQIQSKPLQQDDDYVFSAFGDYMDDDDGW